MLMLGYSELSSEINALKNDIRIREQDNKLKTQQIESLTKQVLSCIASYCIATILILVAQLEHEGSQSRSVIVSLQQAIDGLKCVDARICHICTSNVMAISCVPCLLMVALPVTIIALPQLVYPTSTLEHTHAHNTCRSEKADAGKQHGLLTQENGAMKAQIERKDELIKLLEEEAKRRDDRVAKGETLAAQLAGTLNDRNAVVASMQVGVSGCMCRSSP